MQANYGMTCINKVYKPKYSNSCVIALPIPVTPPVTIATFPLNKFGLKTLLTLVETAILTDHVTPRYR